MNSEFKELLRQADVQWVQVGVKINAAQSLATKEDLAALHQSVVGLLERVRCLSATVQTLENKIRLA